MFIELMMGFQTTLDIVMLQQNGTCPGILGKDQISLLQNLDRPESHVFKITYRSRDNV
jgi:hypothetical protein